MEKQSPQMEKQSPQMEKHSLLKWKNSLLKWKNIVYFKRKWNVLKQKICVPLIVMSEGNMKMCVLLLMTLCSARNTVMVCVLLRGVYLPFVMETLSHFRLYYALLPTLHGGVSN
jgi:hypothetical protein